MTFEKWIRLVDAVLVSRVGIDSGDLPDWHWHDAYSDGSTPSDAADDALDEILREDGFGDLADML